MKFIQILFSTPMVQAILAGKKTMTRRIIKDEQIIACLNAGFAKSDWICPYGQPGDVLWVRESFIDANDYPCHNWHENPEENNRYDFKADCPDAQQKNIKWRPSIHMPKAACRSFLKVKSIKVERLQDISGNDAVAEGCSGLPDNGIAQSNFQKLWLMINGDESWFDNPWIWVIEFKHIEKPENFI